MNHFISYILFLDLFPTICLCSSCLQLIGIVILICQQTAWFQCKLDREASIPTLNNPSHPLPLFPPPPFRSDWPLWTEPVPSSQLQFLLFLDGYDPHPQSVGVHTHCSSCWEPGLVMNKSLCDEDVSWVTCSNPLTLTTPPVALTPHPYLQWGTQKCWSKQWQPASPS